LSDSKRRPTSRIRQTPWAEDVFVDAALPEVLDRVAHTGVRSFDSTICTIWLRNNKNLKLTAAVGVDSDLCGNAQMALGQSVSGLTATSGQPRRYVDVVAEGIGDQAEREPYLTGPLLSAPIAFQGEGLGVINLCRSEGGAPFESEDLERLVASSSAVALAVAAQRVVTEQNRELRDQDQHLRTLFDDAPNPIFVLDWHGRFLEANEAAAAFLERSMAEIAGLSLRDTCPPEVVANLWRDLVVQNSGGPREVIFNGRAHDKILLLNLVPVNVGSAMVYYAIGQDITERHRAEQEKDQIQQQLYLSRRLESVGRLAGGIAHDFNNLLTAILNYASLVAAELPPDSQIHEDVMEIRSAGNRATKLVRQLLAYSRKEVVRPRIVSVNEVVEELVKMLERLLGEHINLDLRLAETLPSIRIDPGQLEQIIVNLAVNAAHAMPQGGRLLIRTDTMKMDPARVHQFVSVHAGDHVRLRLSDTGSGMSEEVVSKIFEPFFTTKDRGEGTGLGLATVYGIVKQADGSIFVDSRLGQGTEFEVMFPAVQESPEVRLPTDSEHPAMGGDELVLLLEDSPGVRNIAARLLRKHGYEVVEASNGVEALALVGENNLRPDLLLTDVVMPGMSGMEVATVLQKNHPSLRVLYMSGYPDSLVSAQGVLMDDVHFVAKPFTTSSLLGAVKEALLSTPASTP
jgi:PAS domain S-box-containing protein